MKKILLLAFAGILMNSANAQTAVNFNVADCTGTNHDLFAELNAGKVIVITWVMPCGACISVASTVANTVGTYSTSYPGLVDFFLADDVANTTCSTLTSWAGASGIIHPFVFSDAAISMSDYGSAGMQKTVVLGGSNHQVFYNVIGTVVASDLQTAINSALATGISENTTNNFQLSLFPNPSNGSSTFLYYTLTQAGVVSIEIYNELGAKVKNINFEKQAVGKHQEQINTESFRTGNYFVKLMVGESSQLVKFTVTH